MLRGDLKFSKKNYELLVNGYYNTRNYRHVNNRLIFSSGIVRGSCGFEKYLLKFK